MAAQIQEYISSAGRFRNMRVATALAAAISSLFMAACGGSEPEPEVVPIPLSGQYERTVVSAAGSCSPDYATDTTLNWVGTGPDGMWNLIIPRTPFGSEFSWTPDTLAIAACGSTFQHAVLWRELESFSLKFAINWKSPSTCDFGRTAILGKPSVLPVEDCEEELVFSYELCEPSGDLSVCEKR